MRAARSSPSSGAGGRCFRARQWSPSRLWAMRYSHVPNGASGSQPARAAITFCQTSWKNSSASAVSRRWRSRNRYRRRAVAAVQLLERGRVAGHPVQHQLLVAGLRAVVHGAQRTGWRGAAESSGRRGRGRSVTVEAGTREAAARGSGRAPKAVHPVHAAVARPSSKPALRRGREACMLGPCSGGRRKRAQPGVGWSGRWPRRDPQGRRWRAAVRELLPADAPHRALLARPAARRRLLGRRHGSGSAGRPRPAMLGKQGPRARRRNPRPLDHRARHRDRARRAESRRRRRADARRLAGDGAPRDRRLARSLAIAQRASRRSKRANACSRRCTRSPTWPVRASKCTTCSAASTRVVGGADVRRELLHRAVRRSARRRCASCTSPTGTTRTSPIPTHEIPVAEVPDQPDHGAAAPRRAAARSVGRAARAASQIPHDPMHGPDSEDWLGVPMRREGTRLRRDRGAELRTPRQLQRRRPRAAELRRPAHPHRARPPPGAQRTRTPRRRAHARAAGSQPRPAGGDRRAPARRTPATRAVPHRRTVDHLRKPGALLRRGARRRRRTAVRAQLLHRAAGRRGRRTRVPVLDRRTRPQPPAPQVRHGHDRIRHPHRPRRARRPPRHRSAGTRRQGARRWARCRTTGSACRCSATTRWWA